MKTTQHILFTMLCCCLLGAAACRRDFLDKPLNDEYPITEAFTDIARVRNWVNNIYSLRQDDNTLFANTGFSAATDEAVHGNSGNNINIFTNGNWSAQNTPWNVWPRCWQGIRKCNSFFKYRSYTALEKYGDTVRLKDEYNLPARTIMTRLTGEVFFMRAFYYMELMRYFGTVPLTDSVYAVNDNFNLPRKSIDSVVAFISRDLDSAMANLPDDYDNYPNFAGRASKPVAMAYKCRLLLYYASPLFNPDNKPERWKAAADLLGTFITAYSSEYGLETTFQNVVTDRNSKEAIFSIRGGGRNDIDRAQRPVGYKFTTGPAVNPSQNLVDAFQMVNGKNITDAGSTYDPANPYLRRDPRFYLFINYNGASLSDNPTGTTWQARPIETFTGGKDAVGNFPTRTGYYMRKFMHVSLNLVTNQTQERPYLLMRYAEVLLNYAEAVNQAYGPYAVPPTCTLTAAAAIEMIRKRAGLVPFTLPVGLSKTQMNDAVVQERRIELCFENQRFWDVRRWKRGVELFNVPVRGVVITKTGTTYTYAYRNVEQHTFQDKMHLFPVPWSEVRANPNMTQNPNWE